MNDSPVTSFLPWTGERYVPEVGGQVGLEHFHRYAFARQFVNDADVLDIACGEGYGTALLAHKAKSVVGVDISEEVIRHVNQRYAGDGLSFVQGSCSQIPLPEASVDVVVSFETIEHHNEHQAMMREIIRVLRPSGLLIISCPEKHEYSDVPGTQNPFHVKELYSHEFEGLIAKFFRNYSIFGQRVAYGSAIFAKNTLCRISSFDIQQPRQIESAGIARPQYLIAVASGAELPEVSSSICEQSINESEYVQMWSRAVQERDAQIAGLTQAAQERDAQVEQANRTIADLRHSTSWRITYPLRVVKRLLGPKKGVEDEV